MLRDGLIAERRGAGSAIIAVIPEEDKAVAAGLGDGRGRRIWC